MHAKLREVTHADFSNCSPLVGPLANHDAAIFCLGAYTGAVSDAELRKVTVDYAVEFARAVHEANPNAAFSFLSGSGADPTGRSRLAFARYKGEAEKAILALTPAKVTEAFHKYIDPQRLVVLRAGDFRK